MNPIEFDPDGKPYRHEGQNQAALKPCTPLIAALDLRIREMGYVLGIELVPDCLFERFKAGEILIIWNCFDHTNIYCK